MEIVKINEPIRVLAAFARGGIQPLRFKWENRSYTIERINGEWLDRADEADAWHFSVQVGTTTYFLHYASRDLQWWLDELINEG